MKLSRREFLKLTGAAAGGLMLPSGISQAALAAGFPLHKAVGEIPTICCFCGVGCGAIVAADKNTNQVINLEGDPDHPINQGSLCSKGMALAQLHTVDGETNPRRLNKVLHRKPNSSEWEEVELDDALGRIAELVKETRDEYFIETDGEGRTVNRLEAIASLGGAALDNEECSILIKALRALGLVYIEHQARI